MNFFAKHILGTLSNHDAKFDSYKCVLEFYSERIPTVALFKSLHPTKNGVPAETPEGVDGRHAGKGADVDGLEHPAPIVHAPLDAAVHAVLPRRRVVDRPQVGVHLQAVVVDRDVGHGGGVERLEGDPHAEGAAGQPQHVSRGVQLGLEFKFGVVALHKPGSILTGSMCQRLS